MHHWFIIIYAEKNTYQSVVIRSLSTISRFQINTLPPTPIFPPNHHSMVNAFASVVDIGLVCLLRFAAELFPQLCSADVLAVSAVSSTFALVCLAGLPRFRLTATLLPTGFSACTLRRPQVEACVPAFLRKRGN